MLVTDTIVAEKNSLVNYMLIHIIYTQKDP